MKIKRFIVPFLCAAMLPALPVFAEDDAAAAADALLNDVSGTYEALFPVITAPEYDQIWLDSIIPVTGEEEAPAFAEMLKTVCNGDLHGQEAIDAYADGSEGMQFDCKFINGVSQITFDGNNISGVDENGEEVFSHEYAYAHEASLMEGMMDGYMHETADEDAGEFKYFFLLPDTPESTYHIEFRYGSDEEALTLYNEGDYAYWLAAGILTDRDDQMINDVITLFCEENMEPEDEALAEGGDEEAADAREDDAAAAETDEDADAAAESGKDADAAVASDVASEAANDAAADEVIEIATAEELAAINDNLSGNYVLTADIDLAGVEWTPIGTFAPSGDSPEEQETPSADAAFTGTFDGNGHTISNLSIDQPEGWNVGLFGCIANTEVKNFTLENASVTGTIMASDVVGYSYFSTVSGVRLVNGTVNVNYTEMSTEGMYGGIVGAGMGSLITDCEAEADIVLPDNVANAGIIGGGLELTSVVNCTAVGTVTAGANCYGLGGISGCGFGAEEFTNCHAEGVTITAGEGASWIGGITGYAGGFEDESAGIPVTVFTGCTAEDVTIDAPEESEGTGEIVGAGFFSEEVAEAMGAPYDQPTVYVIADEAADDAA